MTSGQHSVAGRVARRLLEHAEAVVTAGGDLDPYLRRYLAEHVGEALRWEGLGERIDVLDRLDPDAVAGEAMRSGRGQQPLPAAVVTTMVAHVELRSSSAEQRRLARALAAARLRFHDPDLTDPRLRWSRLRRVVPHLPLTGHTGPVEAVAFGVLPGGRVLLATGGDDATVRLWDPVAATPVGDPLTGHTGPVRAVAFEVLPGGRVLLATAGAGYAPPPGAA